MRMGMRWAAQRLFPTEVVCCAAHLVPGPGLLPVPYMKQPPSRVLVIPKYRCECYTHAMFCGFPW